MFRAPPLTPVVKQLLIALLALLVTQAILQLWVGLPVVRWIALNAGDPGIHWAWQAFTHVTLVLPQGGDVLNLVLSLLFLWWALAPFEQRFGGQRVAQLCVAAALSAALPAMLLGLALGQSSLIGGPGAITITAIAAYVATLPPYSEVSFFGVLPMRPKHLIWLLVGFGLLSFLLTKDVVQLGAHLGSIGGGMAFVRWMRRPPRKRIFKRGAKKKRSRAPLRLVQDEGDERKWLN